MEKPNVNEGGLNLSSAKHCTVQTITWWPLSYLCKQESVELCCGTHRTKFIGCDHKTYKDNSFSWGMFYFSNQYLLLKYSWFTEMLISAVQQRYSFIHIYVCVCVCVCVSGSVVSDSLQPRGLQPTRLLHPWNSPAKNTGVGCHFLLQHIYVYICKCIL